jgi:Flp pilus assembly protein TadD
VRRGAARPDESRAGPAWRRWGPAALLILATLAAYHAGFSGPLVYDDLPAIAENPTIRHLALAALAPPPGGLTVSGRPVLNLSLALNYAVSGTRVESYHAVNLVIHLLAALALFGIARRALARSCAGPADAPALAIALLWAVHPLQTESVLYLAQRAESLMGLFYLLTLYCFIRSAEAEAPSPGRRGWAALAVLACLLGMGTKEVMVSAPVMVLLYDRAFIAGSFREAWRRRRGLYALLAATWLPLAALVAGSGGNRGGTEGFGLGLGWWGYELTQLQAIAHYLRLAVWPSPLVFDYEPLGVRAAEAAPYALVVAPLAAGTAWALWRRPPLGFLGAWFFAILAPTSLLPSGVQTIAEHRMYLPLAAVIAALVVGACSALGRIPTLVLALVAAAGLGCATARRSEAYRSNLALWADTAAQRPGNARAQNNLGQALFLQGRVAEAENLYRKALQLDPGNAQAHYNLANILDHDGRMPEALAEYGHALALRPEFFEAHNNLGLALAKAGRPAAAIAEFQATLRLQPDSFAAHCNLADALAQVGRFPESVEQYEQALRLEPDFAPVQENLGLALAQAGRVPDAVAPLEAAVRLNPGDAESHDNLGMVLGHLGRDAEARAQFAEGVRLREGNGVAPGPR